MGFLCFSQDFFPIILQRSYFEFDYQEPKKLLQRNAARRQVKFAQNVRACSFIQVQMRARVLGGRSRMPVIG